MDRGIKRSYYRFLGSLKATTRPEGCDLFLGTAPEPVCVISRVPHKVDNVLYFAAIEPEHYTFASRPGRKWLARQRVMNVYTVATRPSPPSAPTRRWHPYTTIRVLLPIFGTARKAMPNGGRNAVLVAWVDGIYARGRRAPVATGHPQATAALTPAVFRGHRRTGLVGRRMQQRAGGGLADTWRVKVLVELTPMGADPQPSAMSSEFLLGSDADSSALWCAQFTSSSLPTHPSLCKTGCWDTCSPHCPDWTAQ